MSVMTTPAPSRLLAALLALLALCLFGTAQASVSETPANPYDEPVLHPAIPLLDESGQHVLDSGKPYSSRNSCGTNGCHNYEQITHAYHFEMGRDEASDSFGIQRGLPHLVSPGYFGGYSCMGGNNPDILAKKINETVDGFADKGAAGWVQRCASCHSGGGWMEKDRQGRRYDLTDPDSVKHLDGDYFNRGTDSQNQASTDTEVSQWDWKKSGVVEADCMMCHADYSQLLPHAETPDESNVTGQFSTLRRTKLLNGGHFRYAGSAMLEFLNLNTATSASDTPTTDHRPTLLQFAKDTGDHSDGGHSSHGSSSFSYELALQDGQPQIQWNANAFNDERKVEIPMLKFPANENCMQCHTTSKSRRGFYGFGEVARIETDEANGGTLIEDYQDDVHKGKTWTEANGQSRTIENCNACHSRAYFDPVWANVDLDANHNILKGNSDMDVRNDLDFSPNARSCEYCHDEAPNKAIPSGHDSMLTAHREIWKANGDMTGYNQDSLTRITQTHLDVVSCQACHITNKQSKGKPLQLSYRYREDEKGKLSIVPYNPRIRYYWKDKTSGRVLTKTERNSIYEQSTDEQGNTIGLIKNPINGAVLTTVTTKYSHGSLVYNDPTDAAGLRALKQAYDGLLKKQGLAQADTAMVWTESNEYLISHNAQPSDASLQCAACHEKKQSGAFSALLSETGLFGSANSRVVTTLPDRSLVDDGTVILDLEYMKVQDNGQVTEHVSDILFTTKVDPFMTILKASSAQTHSGMLQRHADKQQALGTLALGADMQNRISDQLGNTGILLLDSRQGNATIRAVKLITDGSNEALADYRFAIDVADAVVRQQATSAKLGTLKSELYQLQAHDRNQQAVTHFNSAYLTVVLPYQGRHSDLASIRVLTSSDGQQWQVLAQEDLLAVTPATDDGLGTLAFRTNHFSYFAVADAAATGTDSSVSPSGSGGGGSTSLWLLGLLAGLGLLARRRQG